ncbi:MAG: hypothetical protein INR62_07225 [Rhodospirillales bacterium]|nr:hypothetical protein [Acetobacter sp.]
MHAAAILESIYDEHQRSIPRMIEALVDLGVPAEDVALLAVLPWELPANRIAVERERLGWSPVRSFCRCKLPPPPPLWLTPAMAVRMFDPALRYRDEDPSAERRGRESAVRRVICPARPEWFTNRTTKG